jgi:hypothetical protein
LKTAHGISKNANGHIDPEPFHGSGQGAADSMPRWGFISDLIIKPTKIITHEAKFHTNKLT